MGYNFSGDRLLSPTQISGMILKVFSYIKKATKIREKERRNISNTIIRSRWWEWRFHSVFPVAG